MSTSLPVLFVAVHTHHSSSFYGFIPRVCKTGSCWCVMSDEKAESVFCCTFVQPVPVSLLYVGSVKKPSLLPHPHPLLPHCSSINPASSTSNMFVLLFLLLLLLLLFCIYLTSKYDIFLF